TRLVLMVVTALVTAAIVSTCGAIGFVALVLPHAARALVGGRHRVLVPTSALMGAIFLVWIDAASRTVVAPQELPVGGATALVGGRHRVLGATSARVGAIFVVWIDAASRTVMAPQELPVGVAPALIGVRAFVVLVLRRGRGR